MTEKVKSTAVGTTIGAVVAVLLTVGAIAFNQKDAPVTPAPVTPAPVTPDVEPTPNVQVLVAGPDTVKPGELVVLSVEGDATKYAWQVYPPSAKFIVVDDGKRLIFSHGSGGEFTFYVAAVKGDELTFLSHSVKVIAPTPPGPPPVPGPADIEGKVSEWADPIQSPTKRDDALKLSQSFLNISSMLASGVLDGANPGKILELTKNTTREALGEGINNWTPFLESLRQELNVMGQAGHLNDAESHATAWRAIGNGLKRYAESI